MLKDPSRVGSVDDKTAYWFRNDPDINENNQSSRANVFIRTATASGLARDGVTPTDTLLQSISDRIGARVLADIQLNGAIPNADKLIDTDISVATREFGMTIGGWGGSFYYWNSAYRDPATGAATTVGAYIQSHTAELEKFISVNAEASVKSLGTGLFPSGSIPPSYEADLNASRQIYNTLSGLRNLAGSDVPPSLQAAIVGRALDGATGGSFVGSTRVIDGWVYQGRNGDGTSVWEKLVPAQQTLMGDSAGSPTVLVADPTTSAALDERRQIRLDAVSRTRADAGPDREFDVATDGTARIITASGRDEAQTEYSGDNRVKEAIYTAHGADGFETVVDKSYGLGDGKLEAESVALLDGTAHETAWANVAFSGASGPSEGFAVLNLGAELTLASAAAGVGATINGFKTTVRLGDDANVQIQGDYVSTYVGARAFGTVTGTNDALHVDGDGGWFNVKNTGAGTIAVTLDGLKDYVGLLGGAGYWIASNGASGNHIATTANTSFNATGSNMLIDVALGNVAGVSGGWNTVNTAANSLVWLTGTNGHYDTVYAHGDMASGTTFTKRQAGVSLDYDTQANLAGGAASVHVGAGATLGLLNGSGYEVVSANATVNTAASTSFTLTGDSNRIGLGNDSTLTAYGAANTVALSAHDSVAVVGDNNVVGIGSYGLVGLSGLGNQVWNNNEGSTVNLITGATASNWGTNGNIGILGTGIALNTTGEIINMVSGAAFDLGGGNDTINLTDNNYVGLWSGTGYNVTHDVATDNVNFYSGTNGTVGGTGGAIGIVGTNVAVNANDRRSIRPTVPLLTLSAAPTR